MSADEWKDKGADGLEKPPERGAYDIAPEWVVKGWKMWINGLRNWSAIAREVGHDWETVKNNITKYSHTLGELYEGRAVNPLAEYVEGNLEDLSFQMRVALKAETAEDLRAASGARKEVTAIREKVAAAQGVVTERKGTEVSGGLDLSRIGNLQPSTRQSIIRDLESEESGEDLADAEGS